jgi:hypothetical protein
MLNNFIIIKDFIIFVFLRKYFHPLLDFIFLVVFIHYGYTILKRANSSDNEDKKAEVEWDRQREAMSKKEDDNFNGS